MIEQQTDYLAEALASRCGMSTELSATAANAVRELAIRLRADIDARYERMLADPEFVEFYDALQKEQSGVGLGDTLIHNYFSTLPESLQQKYGFSLWMWDSGVRCGLTIYVNPQTGDVSDRRNFAGPVLQYPITPLTEGATAGFFDGICVPKE